MSDAPLHRLYHHFSELPYSLRIVYTSALLILGSGYLFALVYIFHTYSGKDGNPNDLSYEDLVIAYSGSGKGSRLESALRGPMSSMLPPDDLKVVVDWVVQGADKAKYETVIRPTIEKRCMACHDGSNPHLPNLNGYDNIKKVTEMDTGADVFTLVRVSHIHLFGITFIFFIMGTIFSHAYVRPVWFKCLVVGLPFLALVLDISSWYFTKLFHPFALVTMGGGALMGMCFAYMWVISIWQMWFAKVPAAVYNRTEAGPRAVG
ncbi:MAG: hypothetical protein ACXWHZ_14860 [Usitatibacter sp.]